MPSGFQTIPVGGALVPEQVVGELVDQLTAEAVVLAANPRAFVAQGAPVRVPRIDAWTLADPWRAENTQIAESDPTFGEVVLLPSTLKSLKVILRLSRELARNAVVDVANVLSVALVRRIANVLDAAMLVGDGAGDTVRGIANATGVQTVPAVGALTVDDLHDAIGLALGANAMGPGSSPA